MAKKLLCEFSKAFTGRIWRLVPHLPSGRLALEIRSDDTHSVAFALLDYATYKLEWQTDQTGTGWYGGLLALNERFVIAHAYGERPEPSEEDRIVVLDAHTGSVLYDIEHVRFLRFTDPETILLASTVEEGNPLLLANLSTGDLHYAEADSQSENHVPVADNKGLTLPLHYTEENAHFAGLAELVEQLTGHEAVREIEYAEWGHLVVISYYLYKEGFLDNFLLIIDSEGDVLYHKTLSENLKGIATDSFFLLNDKVFFINNKNILSIYGH